MNNFDSCRNISGEWMLIARSYAGQGVLENLRVRLTLKRPSDKRVKQETEKQGETTKDNSLQSEEEKKVQDEASYTVVCRMLPHVLSDKAVDIAGEHIILKDQQIRRLSRGNIVFEYEVEIFELVTDIHTGILTIPGFAANGTRLSVRFPE